MIYIHVPFCKRFCIYCDFFSELYSEEEAERFADRVCEEISARSNEIDDRVKTLYFGGGTASVLPLTALSRILIALDKSGHGGPYTEFTIEANPEDIVERGVNYVRSLCALGMNRLSLGVQSFDDNLLGWMNRRHNAARAVEAVRIAREAGVKNLSIDLIFGLSQLSEAVFRQTLDEMTGALKEHRNTRRMLLAFVAAVALSLLAVWIYIEMVPETSTVEFVEPAPKAQTDDLFGSYYDPEMGIIESDTMPVTDLDRMYQQKAEEIFRKRYAQEADRILSEIYDDKRMNGTEKNYRANSQSMAEELIRLQTEMGEQAGLTEEEAGRIAQEIVDKLTQDKQAQITRRATAKGVQGEEEE